MISYLFTHDVGVIIILLSILLYGCTNEHMYIRSDYNTNLEHQIQFKKRETIKLNIERQHLNSEIDKLRSEIKEYNDKITKLDKDIIDIKIKTHKAQSDKNQIIEHKIEIERLQAEVQKMKETLASKELELNRLYKSDVL